MLNLMNMVIKWIKIYYMVIPPVYVTNCLSLDFLAITNVQLEFAALTID